jgi:hypothetical protein
MLVERFSRAFKVANSSINTDSTPCKLEDKATDEPISSAPDRRAR